VERQLQKGIFSTLRFSRSQKHPSLKMRKSGVITGRSAPQTHGRPRPDGNPVRGDNLRSCARAKAKVIGWGDKNKSGKSKKILFQVGGPGLYFRSALRKKERTSIYETKRELVARTRLVETNTGRPLRPRKHRGRMSFAAKPVALRANVESTVRPSARA